VASDGSQHDGQPAPNPAGGDRLLIVERTRRWAERFTVAARDRSQAEMRKALDRRDRILRGVAEAAEQLFDLAPWRDRVPGVMATLGEATGSSRVYMFEATYRRKGISEIAQRFEWVAPGIEPQLDNPELTQLDMDAAGFGRWGELMRAGSPVVGDVHEFPESEQPLLLAQGIQSLLAQPIFAGGRWWGFMGFDACDEPKSWDTVEVDALRIATMLLGSAIQREAREAELRQAQKMEALGRMAGGIAHDFNNALMVIFGGVDLVRRGLARGAESATLERHLAMIEQASNQARGFTRRLLDFSRRSEVRASDFSPIAAINGMRDMLRQAVGEKVAVEIDASGSIPLVRLDPVQFEQVAINLAVNARDAMPEGGRLEIRLDVPSADDPAANADDLPAGRWVRIRFIDSGEGMPPEVLDRIFEPFFTTKAITKGTGLGLAMVYGIVQSARGHIEVSSRKGAGTEFRIYLPAFEGEEEPDADHDEVDLAGQGRSVLVCEDNDANREWIVSLLEEVGFTVRAAASGDEGLAIVERDGFRPDLLVTDVMMPGMTGPALAKRLVTRLPSLPTVMMSGYAADTLEREGVDRAKVTFVDKPVGAEALLEAIRTEFARASSS
jgi:signal transduction histidine kinase/ActR/RegA family two-component response regulator